MHNRRSNNFLLKYLICLLIYLIVNNRIPQSVQSDMCWAFLRSRGEVRSPGSWTIKNPILVQNRSSNTGGGAHTHIPTSAIKLKIMTKISQVTRMVSFSILGEELRAMPRRSLSVADHRATQRRSLLQISTDLCRQRNETYMRTHQVGWYIIGQHLKAQKVFDPASGCFFIMMMVSLLMISSRFTAMITSFFSFHSHYSVVSFTSTIINQCCRTVPDNERITRVRGINVRIGPTV